MLVTMFLAWIWLQIIFMGLFRPNSVDAKSIRVGQQGEIVARKLIRQKMVDMGPMTFHEISVAILFVVSVLLWFFRQPQFIAGWPTLITDHKVRVQIFLLIIFGARSSILNTKQHIFS